MTSHKSNSRIWIIITSHNLKSTGINNTHCRAVTLPTNDNIKYNGNKKLNPLQSIIHSTKQIFGRIFQRHVLELCDLSHQDTLAYSLLKSLEKDSNQIITNFWKLTNDGNYFKRITILKNLKKPQKREQLFRQDALTKNVPRLLFP